MKRHEILTCLVSVASLGISLALFLQNRSLRQERDEALAARTEAAKGVEAPRGNAEETERLAAALKEQASATKVLEAEIAALKEKPADKVAPEGPLATTRKPKPKRGETEPDRPDPLKVGQEPTKEMLETLALDPLQESALRQALKDEAARVQESLRRMYSQMVDAEDHRLEDRSGEEMVMALANKLAPEIADLKELSDDQRERIKRKSASLEEILGEGNRISIVARELHAARAKTYEDLARRLTPEQLEQVRRDYIPEGSFHWPNGVDIDLGPAPADLKR